MKNMKNIYNTIHDIILLMAIVFKKLDISICTIACDGQECIYKFPVNKHETLDLKNEWQMIRKMSKISNVFKTFESYSVDEVNDTHICFPFYESTIHIAKHNINSEFDNVYSQAFNMMYYPHNKNLMELQTYCCKNKTMLPIFRVLNIVHTVFRPNNFIHGDFKLDNIMIDTSNDNIKIIDLDYSIICTDKNTLSKYDNIAMYLKPCTVTKEYLFLYDLWLLATSVNLMTAYAAHDAFEEYYTWSTSVTDTFMDFLIICDIIYEDGCSLTEKDTIDGTFDTISKTLLSISTVDHDEKYNAHVEKIQKIVNENILLNNEVTEKK